MKVVYFGTAPFAVPALRAVAEHVSLVVSQPDRPSGRGMRLQPSPVKQAAEELGIPVETPEKSRSPEFVERLGAEHSDLLLVAAYGQILSQNVLDSSRHGGINLHGSILPKYRGAAPIQRAILQGEMETGVTLMQMDRGMDTGDMIAIERLPIGPEETYGELQDRLAELAARMAREWLPRLAAGDYPRTPQDHELATLAPKVTKDEAELRFDQPAVEEHRRYRAFTPSPGAYFHSFAGRVRVSRAALGHGTGRPGEVVSMGEAFEVAFASGSLHLLEVQPEGKKRMSGRDFANGLRLGPGSQLAPTA
jgi:methionyl-tRNA formyltransferase